MKFQFTYGDVNRTIDAESKDEALKLVYVTYPELVTNIKGFDLKTSGELKQEAKGIKEDYEKQPKGYYKTENIGEKIADVAFPFASSLAREGADKGAIIGATGAEIAGTILAPAFAAEKLGSGALSRALIEGAVGGGANVGMQAGFTGGVDPLQAGLSTLAPAVTAGGGALSRRLGRGLQESGVRTYEKALLPRKALSQGINPPDAEFLLKQKGVVGYGLTPTENFASSLNKVEETLAGIGEKRSKYIEESAKGKKIRLKGGAIKNAIEKVESDEYLTPMAKSDIVNDLNVFQAEYTKRYPSGWMPIEDANKQITALGKEAGVFKRSMDSKAGTGAIAREELSGALHDYISNVDPELRAFSKEMAPYMANRQALEDAAVRTGGQRTAFTDLLAMGAGGSLGGGLGAGSALAFKKATTTPAGAKLQYELGRLLGGLGNLSGFNRTSNILTRQYAKQNEGY